MYCVQDKYDICSVLFHSSLLFQKGTGTMYQYTVGITVVG